MSEDSVDAHNVDSNMGSETDSDYDPAQEVESALGDPITLEPESAYVPDTGVMAELEAAGSQAPHRRRAAVAPRINLEQEVLAQNLAAVLGGIIPNLNAPATSTKRRDPIFDLQKMGAEKYDKPATDPAGAEDWLRSTTRVLTLLNCTPEEKVRCLRALFKGPALVWWEGRIRGVRADRIT